MHCFIILALTLASFGVPTISYSETAWETLDTVDGVEVFRRSFPGKGQYEFRGVGEVSGELSEVLALIVDPKLQTEWVEGCTSSMQVDGNMLNKEETDLRRLFQVKYGTQGVPWPLNDRDYVIKSHFEIDGSKDKGLKSISLMSYAVEHPKHPVSEDFVRINHMQVEVRLSKLPNGTQFDFRVLVDPGGVVPHWIVNFVTESVPQKTISRIRSLVQNKKYNKDHLKL